jgi:hypothetical protein
VVLAPTEPLKFSRDFADYVKEYLLKKPVARGETIIVPVFGSGLKLVVVSTQPSQNVYVTEATELIITTAGETRFWWIGDLLDKDSKALGVYLALLYMLNKYTSFKSKPPAEKILRDRETRNLYAVYFIGRGRELKEAVEAGKAFLSRLFDSEDVLDWTKRSEILGDIEAEFYDKFVNAFKKYLRLDAIPSEYRSKIASLLLDVRSQAYERQETLIEIETLNGTLTIPDRYFTDDERVQKFAKRYGIKVEEVGRLLEALRRSGLAVYSSYYRNWVFPAPCLSDEIINLVRAPTPVSAAAAAAPRERVASAESAERLVPAAPRPAAEKYAGKTPSREILESIVADVLKDLGFHVRTNVKLPAKGGRAGEVEVDVWAYKPEVRFYVYASCKNWDREVDASEIDREFGRVHQLDQIPHLKVFVAKKLTDPARARAQADGFIVVELGEKATKGNAQEIYNLVYSQLKALFYGIAPPELQKLARRTKEVAEELRKIAEEMEKLA